jgi:hypothetical protein
MMDLAVGHLVRRGMTATFSGSSAMNFENYQSEPDKPAEIDIPAWAGILVSTTIVLYFFAATMVGLPAAAVAL